MSDQAEESQGMTLEQYLDSRDSYRSTNLPDLWPYPLMLTDSPELQTTLLPIHDDIHAVLRRHGFPDHIWFMPYVAKKPHYPGGDTAVNLLRVILQAADDHPRRLGLLKDDIAGLLNAKDITDMFVEIVNLDLCFLPSFFPMSPEHPLVVGFEAGKQKILDLIQATLEKNWRLLCPFNVGRAEAKARPAIVIIVDPMTRANWSSLETGIKSLLARHCQFQTVEVEFLPGDLSFLNGISFAGRTDVPAMGSSVDIHGDSNSGTLGGYVTLTQGDKILKGFLTNYHVVRPLDPKSGPDKNLANLDRFGSSHPIEKTIEMESFSGLDTQATLSQLDHRIEYAEEEIKQLSEKVHWREEIGGNTRDLQNMLNQYQSMACDLRRQRQHVSEMPIVMGKVTAASGKAILGRRIMDWAFVEMNDTAIEKFFRPNYMFPVQPDQQPDRYKDKGGFAIPAGLPLTEFGRLVEGDVYLKLGRTTGVTTGVCHGALACCQWVGKSLPRYDHDGHEDGLSSIVTEEYVILSKKQQSSQYQQASFTDDGDSGSLVIDQRGRVCGLLYSGTTNYTSGYAMAGLVTDIWDLSESVKLRTVPKDEKGNVIGAPAELGLP